MAREIKIDHADIMDPQKITDVQEQRFKDEGLNTHVHEVESLTDDHKRKQRIIRVKNTRYFFLGK